MKRQTFITEFIPLLDHLKKCKSEVIIAGDYDIDLLQIKKMQYLANILIMLLLKVLSLKLHYAPGSRAEIVRS